MQVRFLGPLGRVTGSCTWLRDAARGWNILIDCGMRQGEGDTEPWNRGDWPFDPSTITHVVLTHAHIDHSGLLPRLVKDGFPGTVYCTRETAEIATELLNDCARLGGLYTEQDVQRIKWHEHRAGPVLGGFHPIATDLFVQYFRTAHIVGAVSVRVVWGPRGPTQRSITFSGDLGTDTEDEEQLPFLRHRMYVAPSDFVVIESTYGDRVRDADDCDGNARRVRLRRLVDATARQRGVLILPVFSLGRAQDVLYDIQRIVNDDGDDRELRYLFDAPLASRIHGIIARAFARTEANGRHGRVRPLWLGKQWFRAFELDDKRPEDIDVALSLLRQTLGVSSHRQSIWDVRADDAVGAWRSVVSHVDGRQRAAAMDAAARGSTVVIASGGMCEGGPVIGYLAKTLRNPRTTVALPGYCSPDTLGGKLLALVGQPPAERARHTGTVMVGVEKIPMRDIAASVVTLRGYSAHADQPGLVDWLFPPRNPDGIAKVVFVQHGDDGQRHGLAAAIRERGGLSDLVSTAPEVIVPSDPTQWYDLDNGASAVLADERRAALMRKRAAIDAELAALE